MKKTTKGKSIGVSLLAALMAPALLVSAASALASTPANPTDPAAGGPVNPCYRMEPQHRFHHCEVVLEPDSDSQGHPDAIGQAYWAHRDFWPPCWSYVTGRSDTEADADRIPAVTHTRVYVRIYLERQCWRGRWWVKASDSACTDRQGLWYPGRDHEYDVDIVVRAPMYWGGAYWRTITMHRVYRDGSTILRWQTTPAQRLHWASPPQDKTPMKP